ncbi:hypothetical protein CVIRNUC_007984 [Coccomyxa viridis]|uniref:Amidase domain-containing protein n=1 Tax=Coccomyxa viridis TaxID=1274662 RepID=A0AAV1IEC8_9CHLO|nr:hypothetical protein CVIRNUC_007984 [Coccomyxa viridis]
MTALQYAEAVLEIAETYSCLNIFSSLDRRTVLAEARAVDALHAAGKDVKPLCGLAFAVKDNIDVAGYPTTAGTPALEGFQAHSSSPLVTRLLKGHGVVLGKTRMHELAVGVTTINMHGGPVLNPYNNTMHTGGSSGGAAAAVAMRMGTAGFCSDTGGSCRIPAGMTGVVGFRPTTGCWNAGDGIVPMTVSRDTVGVVARSVRDVMLFNTIFSDCSEGYPEVDLKGMRMGYPTNFWQDLGEETVAAYDKALAALKGAGVELVAMDMHVLTELSERIMPDESLYTYEMPRELSRYLYQHEYNLSLVDLVDRIATPHVKKYLEAMTFKSLNDYPTPKDYAEILDSYLPKLKALWHDFHDAYDVEIYVVPTSPITSRPIDDVEPYTMHNGHKADSYQLLCRTHQLDCPLGIPGLSIPAGLGADDMPVGIMFYARTGHDDLLLAVGQAAQPLFAATPEPARMQPCMGCKPVLKAVNVTWDGQGVPEVGDTTSSYTLGWSGECDLSPGAGSAADSKTEL